MSTASISPFLTPSTPSTPSDSLTPLQHKIEEKINSHPLVRSLRSNPLYTESRPHANYPEQYRVTSLTAGTLSGPGRVEVPPYIFVSNEPASLVSVSYLGANLCGHPGIVHGGLLATLLDEGLGRCAFISLPNHIGVTASLTINYKRPTEAEDFIVLRAWVEKIEGRKCWVKGSIERMIDSDVEQGPVLVEAEALFIEPRGEALERLMRPGGHGPTSTSAMTAAEGSKKVKSPGIDANGPAAIGGVGGVGVEVEFNPAGGVELVPDAHFEK